MLAKRIIPCLDVKDGEVVKGVNFVNLTSEGNPVELAEKYSKEGADELVFLDITATLESRNNVIDLVKEVAKKVFIPFTVGGGVRSVKDISELLNAGADKVSINSAALKNPKLLNEASNRFGSQCIVLAVDIKRTGSSWNVFSHGGSRSLDINAIEWIKEAEDCGVGEILLTSMDADGTQAGVDLEITKMISDMVSIPVIASGGIGSLDHFKDAFNIGKADAVLAASVFHRDIIPVQKVKKYLTENDIQVR
ncbi:MAG: imidazole glycerol phosphate synthase subunit HisF [Candidatus Marinimicrobia bacterium]|jgi:cyclase|nr:imidazole glycerol phosphate synthase subunit HisF [Candidatus Neomarinimicrobiota bacterium]MBT3936813.1 imidazole glycerol phosphate synthase subunit HisF [Candidatus Neomarinimicrobiota bacterium]MBT3961992.1 imidazole glycerol phosphate synthase subunit HisF [Candidatus Neomarinimicrobiota bacterium]MBT4383682.1 imidazole glycerol phosphate synthase subunit HisF [Candidatus Neomarinimicrobiota bacterium]MBT4637157.1 imidazole glycerol phosphate synthase subunit HisF [Candidatus Neomarini